MKLRPALRIALAAALAPLASSAGPQAAAVPAQLALNGGLPLLDEASIWPQWRGPHRDGRSPGDGPTDVSTDRLAETWRVDSLGPSYSGPVVDGERVYTTGTVGDEREVVRAFDRRTGKELWSTDWEGAMQVPFFAARNGSWIRSTPAIHDGALFVTGMRDVLVCLDAESGELRWKVDFCERFGADLPPFGGVSSPLPTADALYVQAADSVLKLDPATGATLWRSMVEDRNAMSGGAFSSPVLATIHGSEQLVVQSRAELAGLDTEDGTVLWSTPVEAYRGMNILTPMVVGDEVFTSTYRGRSHRFDIDTDESGDFRVEHAWEGRASAYMCSPVVFEGHAYLFLQSNRFACVDLASGEQKWISEPTGDDYWSLAIRGDRILALADTGMLRSVRATPEGYEVLSERQATDEDSWAHIAPAGDQLFVRGRTSLTAFTWK